MSEKSKKVPVKKPNFEEVIQRLEQAKLDGNKNQIKFWTDVLNKLKNKPR